ncbi:MAG: sodium:proton antiporter [Oscillospiraceae bacterium]|nr:sodium:proton antiporter [Oscillospiraceae bacterium]
MINFLLPIMVFVPIIFGFAPVFVKDLKKLNLAIVIMCATELVLCLWLFINAHHYEGIVASVNWFSGLGVKFEINGLGVLQAVATSVIWVGSSVFSEEYFDHDKTYLARYYAFFCVTFGATLGIFLAYDLFTVFVFFETMSFASYALVAHNQDEDSIAAGNSYLTVAVLGGLMVLMGVFVLNSMTGTLVIHELKDACAPFINAPMLYAAGFMIFFGFAAKAGMFPLHGWLPKAHPAAPAPASAALSGILIKAGVYGVIVVTLKILSGSFEWACIMLALGVLTMFVGAVFALMSINLKETLAYSSMSQIGFIIIGVAMTGILGDHGAIPAYGTVLHMINHTLIKLVLFTSAGVVYANTHSLNLNEIQGFGKDKPFLKTVFAVAAMGIMGIPGFNGYISKTLLHEGIVEYIHMHPAGVEIFQMVEAIFLISGGFTVAYMTKLFICLFVKQPTHKHHKSSHGYITKRTMAVLSVVAVIISVFGLFPHATMDKIAESTAHFMGIHALDHSVEYFAFVNLKGGLISITIGILVYMIIVRGFLVRKDKGYINPYNKSWTVENKIFRPLLFTVLPFIGGFASRVMDVLPDAVVFVINRLFCKSVEVPDTFFYGKPETEGDVMRKNSRVHITRSLAYSLMLFGIGLVVTLIYLLVAEFRI